MAVQTSNIIPGQEVATGGAAKLTFTTLNGILSGASVVPAGCVVLITSLLAINTTNGVVTLQVWKGTSATDPFALFGQNINVPPSTQYAPNYQCLSAPMVLMPGDSIWANAGGANEISMQADGQVITQ